VAQGGPAGDHAREGPLSDNVAHSLAGWALSRTAGEERPRGTTLALVLASNLPDIDVVLMARSDAAYLLFHRGLTHSFLGLLVLPPLLALALWWGLGKRTRLAWLLGLTWLGAALHVLYDLLTSWGTMLLYPFSFARLSLDWIFIVDPVTWLAPIMALVVAWRRPARSRAAALAFLACVGAWAALSGAVHAAAVREVARADRAAGRDVREAFAFPAPGSPWRWRGFAVAPAESLEVARYAVSGLPPAARDPAFVARGFGDPWVARALDTRAGQAYLWWAEVPVASVDSTGSSGAVTVSLADLRYVRSVVPTAEMWSPFSLRITFDRATGELREVRW